MILSFHPCYVADINRLCAGRDPDEKDLELISAARAVILPQGCRCSLFEAARSLCRRVFPDYTARFAWPDKTGQIRMFRHFNAPHPRTAVFDSLKDYCARHSAKEKPGDFDFPLVFKYNGPGEGSGVWLAENRKQMQHLLEQTARWEKTGQYGFLIQRYVETEGWCLRVVIVGTTLVTYWRLQPEPERFHVSAARGAEIDHKSFPELQKAGEEQVKLLCEKTGINLAGFDLIFPAGKKRQTPLLLEANYYFGRRGLGGSEAFYDLLCREIDRWLKPKLSVSDF
ncbi:MAG: RimK family alpha-L-glutamate ligase [Desulfobacterales bacterium]